MSTDAKRFYAILGVDPAASDEVIRTAFRRRAKELHPDSPSGNAGGFILLKRAYDTLMDPDARAAYDLACQPRAPRPAPQAQRTQRTQRRRPPQPRVKPSRRGGVGITRYVIAFILMAAISIGGVQAMISWTGAPPSIQTRATASRPDADATSTPTSDAPTAPGSSKSGFWDATPASPGKKSP